jgi:hypothetical protein
MGLTIHHDQPPGTRESQTPVDRLADVLRRADRAAPSPGIVASSVVAYYAGRRFETLPPPAARAAGWGSGGELWRDLDSGELVDPLTLTQERS